MRIEAGALASILTVFDWAIRHLWLADFHGAHSALAGRGEILDRIPEELRRSLTWGQGREMASHQQVAEPCGMDNLAT